MASRFIPHFVFLSIVLGGLAWSTAAAILLPFPEQGRDYDTGGFLVRHSWVKFARVGTSPFRGELSEAAKDARVARYFELNQMIVDAERTAGDSAASRGDAVTAATTAAALREKRSSIENTVEEILEGRLTAVLYDLGLTRRIGADVVWPPVSIEFEEPPSLLVASPRHEIRRGSDRLLASAMPIADRIQLESEVEADGETSALIVNVGAIALYPAIVPPRTDYRSTLHTIAHEWIHHYLFFAPLGRSFYDSDRLLTLNETAANIAGDEIGERMFERYPLERVPEFVSAAPITGPRMSSGGQGHDFDFGAEMRNLRLAVDALLEEGRIDEAEALMEERRLVFQENGYYIRRINQAYFAFHGSYADTPASSDPIGPKMAELRDRSLSLKRFLERVREFKAVEDLDRALQ
jgi:hypothetical protein